MEVSDIEDDFYDFIDESEEEDELSFDDLYDGDEFEEDTDDDCFQSFFDESDCFGCHMYDICKSMAN